VFNEHMPGSNQLDRLREDVVADPEALLAVPQVRASSSRAGPRAFESV